MYLSGCIRDPENPEISMGDPENPEFCMLFFSDLDPENPEIWLFIALIISLTVEMKMISWYMFIKSDNSHTLTCPVNGTLKTTKNYA